MHAHNLLFYNGIDLITCLWIPDRQPRKLPKSG